MKVWTMVKYAAAFIGGCVRALFDPNFWRPKQ
jgi:hypothetical protein